jgi:hypothetical protein
LNNKKYSVVQYYIVCGETKPKEISAAVLALVIGEVFVIA